ncbi:MAG: hypothetical protein Crog4KO_32330 [Crocinitomicaceae bacterium]
MRRKIPNYCTGRYDISLIGSSERVSGSFDELRYTHQLVDVFNFYEKIALAFFRIFTTNEMTDRRDSLSGTFFVYQFATN